MSSRAASWPCLPPSQGWRGWWRPGCQRLLKPGDRIPAALRRRCRCRSLGKRRPVGWGVESGWEGEGTLRAWGSPWVGWVGSEEGEVVPGPEWARLTATEAVFHLREQKERQGKKLNKLYVFFYSTTLNSCLKQRSKYQLNKTVPCLATNHSQLYMDHMVCSIDQTNRHKALAFRSVFTAYTVDHNWLRTPFNFRRGRRRIMTHVYQETALCLICF